MAPGGEEELTSAFGRRTPWKLAPGMKVTVFEDPLSRSTPEGQATLVEFQGEVGIHDGHPLESWDVDFNDWTGVIRRTIWAQDPG